MPVGSRDVHAVLCRLGIEVRYAMRWLGWALLTAFSTASCCSFGVLAPSGSWRVLPPQRSARPAPERTVADISLRVEREAERGIREIERYLAAVGRE
jgi:hypothetical protein